MPTRTETLLHTTVESPIGPLLLLGDGEALRGLYMQAGRKPLRVSSAWREASEPFADARISTVYGPDGLPAMLGRVE